MSRTITRIGAAGAGALLALGIFATPPAGATGGRDGKGERRHAACFTDSGKTQGRSQSDPDGMSNGGFDKPGCTGGFDADRDGNNGCGNDADREDDNNGRCGGKKDRPAPEPRAEKAQADKVKVEADRRERGGDDTGRDRQDRCAKHDGSTTTTTTSTAVAGASTSSGKCACPLGSEAEFTAVKASTVAASVAASGTTVNGTAADATMASTDATVAAAGTPAPAVAADAGTAGTAPTSVESASATTPGTEVLGESITRPSALARTGAGVGGLALLGGLLCGSGRVAILARRFLRID